MIRILLTSDLHLGIPETESPVPGRMRIETFKRLTGLAKSYDLFLIAGDLFENKYIDKRTLDIIRYEFHNLRKNGTEIIYVPGDSEAENGTYSQLIKELNATYVFSDTGNINVYSYSKDGEDIYLYGIPSFNDYNITRFKKISEKGFHLGIFHADFGSETYTGTEANLKISNDDIKTLNLDFYALGHYHQFKLFKNQGRIFGVYPGSPESTSYKECGDRYAISLSIGNNEATQMKRLTVNSVSIIETLFDCAQIEGFNPVMEAIIKHKSHKVFHRIILNGQRNFMLDYPVIGYMKNEYYKLFIEDNSLPNINVLTNEFRTEDTLRGEFFSLLEETMKTNPNKEEIDTAFIAGLISNYHKNESFNMEDFYAD